MQTKKYFKWLITTETQCFPSLRPCLQSVYIEVMTAFPTTFSAAEGVTSQKNTVKNNKSIVKHTVSQDITEKKVTYFLLPSISIKFVSYVFFNRPNSKCTFVTTTCVRQCVRTGEHRVSNVIKTQRTFRCFRQHNLTFFDRQLYRRWMKEDKAILCDYYAFCHRCLSLLSGVPWVTVDLT